MIIKLNERLDWYKIDTTNNSLFGSVWHALFPDIIALYVLPFSLGLGFLSVVHTKMSFYDNHIGSPCLKKGKINKLCLNSMSM